MTIKIDEASHGVMELALSKGHTVIFGYGSLLLQRSMELTLGRRYEQPRFPCALRGWRRSWNVYMPNRNFYESGPDGEFVPRNIVYLNLSPAGGETVNGVLYVVDPAALAALDRREWVYDRRSIARDLVGVTVGGSDASVYVGKPEWTLDLAATRRESAGLRQSYLGLIEESLTTLGTDFRAAYERSTNPIPHNLVFDDRKREDDAPC